MKLIHTHQLELPESFQKDFFKKIFHIVKCAESALIIAPSGMGKTLILELLENEQLQNLYLPGTQIFCHHLDLLDNRSETFVAIFDAIGNLSPNDRFIMIGDNADVLDSPEGKQIIQKLKAVREKARPQISIIFASEKNVLGSSAFSENSSIRSILMENVLFLPPLNEADSEAFAKATAKQQEISLSQKPLTEIAKASGGAPRIIKRLVKLSLTNEDPISDPKLTFDLEAISRFQQSNPLYPYTTPLLSPDTPAKTGKDHVGNLQLTSTLTKQEYDLAKTLIEAKGELVSREEMIHSVWPKNLYETSEHALDQMIHRLRQKLSSANPACTLTIYRGRGAKLVIQVTP